MSDSNFVLVYIVDAQDTDFAKKVEEQIRNMTDVEFKMIIFPVERWNDDLSPWPAPAVFGKAGFGGESAETLERLTSICNNPNASYILGGYSLAGLFSLWAACESDLFTGVAAASPSVWFPGFVDYMKEHPINSKVVYLSLGNRESKTKNPTMSQVDFCISSIFDMLQKQQLDTILDWNEGNHFKDVDIRSAKAFAWTINSLR
jgi:predicted alpha/beta superfamily hydrolase